MTHTFILFVLAYLLAVPFGLHELGIWIAYPVANLIALGLAYYYTTKKNG